MPTLTIALDQEGLDRIQQAARQLGVPVEELVSQSVQDFCSRQLQAEEFDVRAMYPHMVKTFGREGWDDPEMDSYNELDPRRWTPA